MNRFHSPSLRRHQLGHHGKLWPLVIAMLAITMFAATPSANAAPSLVILPKIPTLPAKLSETGAVVGTSLQGSVSIIDPEPLPIPTFPFFQIQSASDLYSTPLLYNSVSSQSDDVQQSDNGRAVAIGSTSGFVNSTAIASSGKLRGQATAGGGGGSVDGVATATAMFVDTITLVHGAGYMVDWNVHGSVTGGIATLANGVIPRTRPGASAQIRAQVWWIPYSTNLTQAAASDFLGTYYASSTWEYNRQTGETVITTDIKASKDLDGLPINIYEQNGSKFWVVGLLEVTAVRGSGDSGTILPSSFVTGTANFLNTVEMNIESLAFPGESDVISASGHDYSRPVPEPSSLALLAIGGIFLRRPRKLIS